MFAEKKLMLESLLNFRFRGTTLKYADLLVALENLIIDKVSTVPTVRQNRVDTRAPMEVGMAGRDDSESSREQEESQWTQVLKDMSCLNACSHV